MATSNSINANSTGIQKYDGAGTFSGITVTNHAPLIGAASNGITSGTLGTDGQVFLGATGGDPAFATLAGTGGITFTTGANSLTINATGGGLTWSVVTADTSFVTNTGTIANKAGLLTMTLPASAVVGDILRLTGINTDLGWKIAQNALQQIFFGTSSSTAGVTGSLSSTKTRDSVEMVCVVGGASTVWNVIDSVGNITIA